VACETVVDHEDAFIDLAFEMGSLEGLCGQGSEAVYPLHRRPPPYRSLACSRSTGSEENPLPWMDEMLNGVEHANFFENRSTEYSKAATQGSWEEAFE
jgi:ribonucleoside-diphosphate reductase beta chain